MLEKFAAFAWYVGITAFLYFVFAYLADLTSRQSLVLAVVIVALLAILNWEMRDTMRYPRSKLTPYYVWVYPNWAQLLTDFKLIGRPDEWTEIEKAVEQEPLTEYRVLRSGIRFTILQESSDFQESLIYWDNDRSFVTKVNFGVEIKPIRTAHGDVLFVIRRCWQEKVGAGYALGIYVPEHWWYEVKTSCPKPLEAREDWTRGRIELILAIVSEDEFEQYREPIWKPYWIDRHVGDKKRVWWKDVQTRRGERRSKFGWKRLDPPEGVSNWPEDLEHKYFRLRHQDLSRP